MKRILAVGLMVSSVAQAALLPTESEYYYQLGGSSGLYIPPVNRDTNIVIGGNLRTSGLLNCNHFNPVISITNSFQDLKTSVSGIPAAAIDNLKGAVAGVAMYKLQQAMPRLYNLLQNTSIGAQNEVSLKVSDCMRTKQNLEAGNSPINSILSISDSQGWIETSKRALQGEPIDVVKASKDHAKLSEEYGIPWVHRHTGNSGGASQTPIHVIGDVVIAGYNLLLKPSRNLDDLSTPMTEIESTPFRRFWPKPMEAADWANLILGDIQISAKKEPEFKSAKAGFGLSNILQSCPKGSQSTTCVANVAAFLWDLVDEKEPLSEFNLKKISVPNLLITADIITGIQRMSDEQKLLTVSKLAEEIAIQNLLEEAMMLRRLLISGSQIQEVQNLKPAFSMVNQAIKRLDSDIHSLAFENEVRQKLMTKTLQLIMDLRNHQLLNHLPGEEKEKSVVKNGAVYRQALGDK